MKILSFSVRNFRSITDAKKIDFRKYTVLIGKNNEGELELKYKRSINYANYQMFGL